MSISMGFLMPHPPLAVPSVGRGEEKAITKTLKALDRAASEIAELSPEVIIFITPHNIVYSDYFHISPGSNASGDLSGFGAPQEKFEAVYDEELADRIISLSDEYFINVGTLGERNPALDHGVTVPMWFINQRYGKYKTVRICQSGYDALTHYKLGKMVADAVNRTGRLAAVVASGDLSHKMSEVSSYGFSPDGPVFDGMITSSVESGDFNKLLSIPEQVREYAAECGYNSVAMLAGCFDGFEVESKLLSYEGPFGVGYAVAEIKPRLNSPSTGRNFYETAVGKMLENAREKRRGEDAYRSLARQSLEHFVVNKSMLPLPEGLPDELLTSRAGVFVSIHKNGRLRGCVGTVAPTQSNIGLEIVQNAVSAGVYDDRFEPVEENELPLLTYKVDILSEAELISGIHELDVRRYGVIVSSGGRRGLLLPNLDGVDTAEQQVAIARQKGNIPDSAAVRLERFEVIRHE